MSSVFDRLRGAPRVSLDSERVTLFNQSKLPEDLRLPLPAEPFFRTLAGLTDLLVSLAIGCTAYLAVRHGVGDLGLALNAGGGAALAAWMVRDAVCDEGNRSLGKKIFRMEITDAEGGLATRTACLLRSWHYGIIVLMPLHPAFDLTAGAILVFDLASLLVTPDARKLADYTLGTRVTMERPNRALRVQDATEADELALIRAQLMKSAPDFIKEQDALERSARVGFPQHTPTTGEETDKMRPGVSASASSSPADR
jgi:hypothetical protein